MPERPPQPQPDSPGMATARERIEKARRDGSTELDLMDLQLTTLPEALGQLTALHTLNLENNQLTTLPEALGQLTALQSLSLRNNQLTTLPEALGQLTALRTLFLNNNQLTTLPEALGQLTALQTLFLDHNQLTTLPEALGQLTALRTLFLNNNQLTTLPEALGQLTALQTLFLDHNQLTTLPEALGQLTALQELSLSNNQLTTLPEALGQLTALQTLYLGNNQLTTLPEALGQLTALQSLSLHNNQLTTLPEALGQLTALQSLSLHNNQLTTLPEALGQLRRLERLILEGNALRELPESLRGLEALKELTLHGNEALGLPAEVLGPTYAKSGESDPPAKPREILEYYFRTQERGRALNEVKIMLVGRGGAGKTSLVRRLVENRFNAKEKETPGVSITDWELECGRDRVKAHFWDFAGQEITHGTHQFFFTQRCVYVLLLTGREGTAMEDADYWLRMIEAFGGDAPVLVVLNKIGEHPFDVDEAGLRQEHPNIRAFHRMECRSRKAEWREGLLSALAALVDGLDSVRKLFPGEWMRVKNRLSGMKEPYLDLKGYRKLCKENGVKGAKEQDELCGWLHTLGIALNYADDERVSHALVLNPRWITNGIYSILRGVEKAAPAGELRVDAVKKWLPKEKPTMRRYLVDLMRKYELCFALDEKEGIFLVPAVLPVQSPPLDAAWLEDEKAVRLRYEYAALPHGVIARFIVRTHRFIKDEMRWRYGVVLAWEGATALVRAHPAKDKIDITLRGPTDEVQRLAAVVREHFENIHDLLKGLKPVEWIEVQPGSDVYERVTHLAEMEKKPGPVFVASPKGAVEVDETKVLNQMEPEAIRKNSPEGRLRVFVSYAHADMKLKEMFDVNLTILSHQKLIVPWTDKRILGGEDWNEVIETNERKAELIVFLVSRNFLASRYIRDHEIPVALEQKKKEGTVIVPIILHKYDGWQQEEEWGKLHPLPAWGKTIEDYPTPEKGFDAADAELRQVIEKKVKELTESWIKGEHFTGVARKVMVPAWVHREDRNQ